MTSIAIVPGLDIIETAFLARERGSIDHPCHKIFYNGFIYNVDCRERIIHITQNVDQYLYEKRYKDAHQKRFGFLAAVRVREHLFNCDAFQSQLELASQLAVSEDKLVHYVTDNKSLTDLLTKNGKVPFQVIDSAKAVKLIEEEHAKNKIPLRRK